MHSITADYSERIIIPPEDVIPKSSWFKYVKVSLLTALMMLILVAIFAMIISESFASNRTMGSTPNDSLAIGVVSMVGIILFVLGLIAIFKEHIPLILTFAVSMIGYLLLFMYARVPSSPGLILLRTFILLLLAVESFAFIILIRDWRAIQISRLNQRLLKEAQLAQYASSNSAAYYGQQQYSTPSGYLPPRSPALTSQLPYGQTRPPTIYSMSYRNENVYAQLSGPNMTNTSHLGPAGVYQQTPRYFGPEKYIQ